jgi:quinol monooxygenase YgiN
MARDPAKLEDRRLLLTSLGTVFAMASFHPLAWSRSLATAGDTHVDSIAGVANQLIEHGYFLMVAEWELKEGNIDRAREIIHQYRPYILKAEGIKIFLAAQEKDDPNHILFYEAYETEEHYKKHVQSDAFQKYIIQEGLPLVVKRTLTRFTLL